MNVILITESQETESVSAQMLYAQIHRAKQSDQQM
jgi:hypothetical protein